MAVKRWNGTSWDTYSASPNLNNTLSQWKKTAAGGETTLSGNDDSSVNLAYTVGQESVYINGVLQVRGSDYTATNGSSIVLVNQLVAGNIVQVISPLLLPMSSVIPLSTIAAKGDLMIGTASSVPARLPIGANDQVLVADSTSSNGMAWKGFAKQSNNAVINGAFDIWQRGTSLAVTTSYIPDRWISYRQGDGSGATVSRQLTGDTTTLPNIQYCARVSRDSGNTGTAVTYLMTSFETFNVIPFAGKAITVSFYARKGATYSASSSDMGVRVVYGTGTDSNLRNGFTGQTNLIDSNAVLTTSWQRFTYTGTLPSSTSQLGINFYTLPTGTAGATDHVEITGVQLELGSVATSFSRAGGDIQGELAKCQRYYQRYGGTQYMALGSGVYTSTTNCRIFLSFPVILRGTPTFSYSAATDFGIFNGSGNDQLSAIGINSLDINTAAIECTVTARTAGYGGILNTRTNTSAYIAFSSEL